MCVYVLYLHGYAHWTNECIRLKIFKIIFLNGNRFANPGGIKGEEGTPGYMAPEAIKRRGEDQAFDEKVHIHVTSLYCQYCQNVPHPNDFKQKIKSHK